MDSSTFWLAVIAIASVVQSVVVVGMAIGALKFSRQAALALERIERETMRPLAARTERALDSVERLARRLETTEDQVRDAVVRTGERALQVAGSVRSGLWPVIGLGQAALAAFSALTARRRSSAARLKRSVVDDEEARFVYEGGNGHARTLR